jgi:hypothetical protein
VNGTLSELSEVNNSASWEFSVEKAPPVKLITVPNGTGYSATIKGVKAQTKDTDTTVSSVALKWTPSARDTATTQIVIDVYAPKPKGKGTVAPLVATAVLDAITGEVIDNRGATVTVTKIGSSFKIIISGLDSGTKYTLEMQAKNDNGGLSKMTKTTATTKKYAAVKKDINWIKEMGEVTITWKASAGKPAGAMGTGTSGAVAAGDYVVGIYDTKAGKFVDLSSEGVVIGAVTATATGFKVTITGLAAQKYTIGVQEKVTASNGDTAKSAIAKFVAAPLAYKAPKFTQPTKLNGTTGAVTLNLAATSATNLPAGYTTGNYEVGVLVDGRYVWGDEALTYLTGELTSTVTVGAGWTITGTDKLKKGLKIAVRVVVYDPADPAIVATKSAMQKITVK